MNLTPQEQHEANQDALCAQDILRSALAKSKRTIGYAECEHPEAFNLGARAMVAILESVMEKEFEIRRDALRYERRAKEACKADLRTLGEIINRYRPDPS